MNSRRESRRYIPPCIPDDGPDSQDRGSVRAHPLLGGAVVIVLLAVSTGAPALRHHAAVILTMLRDVTAVVLVIAAYLLVRGAVRGATAARPVRRPAPADWFEKYRPEPGRAPVPGPSAIVPPAVPDGTGQDRTGVTT